MVRLFTLCILFLFLAFPVSAEDWPAAELSVGPSVMRAADQYLLGGQVGVTVNRWPHFSVVGTFGFHQGNLKTFSLETQAQSWGECDYEDECDRRRKPREPVFITTGIGDVYTYLGGLRIRKSAGRFMVFAQGQAGGARIENQNGFAVAAGGGVQISITQRYAVEARVEYVPMKFSGAWLDDNAQATVGLVIRFGPWWGGFRKP